MNLDLSGRTALVTGSTKGIGYATAIGLARMGATVFINGRHEGPLRQAVERAQTAAPQAHFGAVAADLSKADGARRLFDELPQVDVLVNNVGAYAHKEFFDITDAEWEGMLTTNFLSGVRTTRHYLKGMLAAGWGRVVNVASESGAIVPKEMIHYGVSKAAQLAFSRGVAELTVGTEVTVNSVLPGPTWVETVGEQVKQRASSQGVDEEAIKRATFEVRRPSSLLKRYTTPEEVASAICYLCSPAASATNGAPVRVDGGILRGYV